MTINKINIIVILNNELVSRIIVKYSSSVLAILGITLKEFHCIVHTVCGSLRPRIGIAQTTKNDKQMSCFQVALTLLGSALVS